MNRRLEIIQSDPEVPAGVFADLLAGWQVPFRIHRADLAESLPEDPAAVVVLGGRMGICDEALHPFLVPLKAKVKRLACTETPLLGLCLGGQLLADAIGGVVSSDRCGEKGLVEVRLNDSGPADPLFAGLGKSFQAFQWHNDSFTVPLGAEHLASSVACPGQAFRYKKAWGLQFHPEVDAATVATWSKDCPESEKLVSEFSLAMQAHYQLAKVMLGNFLAIAGWSVSR